jgi:hypothetical protein
MINKKGAYSAEPIQQFKGNLYQHEKKISITTAEKSPSNLPAIQNNIYEQS